MLGTAPTSQVLKSAEEEEMEEEGMLLRPWLMMAAALGMHPSLSAQRQLAGKLWC
jgi:hypothetical protein